MGKGPFIRPYCRSRIPTWKGYRQLVNGKVRLRKCNKCGRKFTARGREKND